MSDDPVKKIKSLKNRMPGRDYKVGYGKPPASTRFVKGQSGNPKGRPKGSKNKRPALNEERLGDIIREEAYRPVQIKEGEKRVTITMAEAIMRSIAVNAARGNQRAQKMFIEMLSKQEAKDRALYDEHLHATIDYKSSWEREIDHCKRLGITPPEPVPHPDQMKIDLSTGQITITGPRTKEEKVRWEALEKRKADALFAIEIYRRDLEDPENRQYEKLIKDEIAFEQGIAAMISEAIPAQ